MPGDESWEGCPHSDKRNQDGCGKPVSTVEKTSYDSSSLIVSNCSQVSSSTVMSGSRTTPLYVYRRKKLSTSLAQTSIENNNGDGFLSAISSESHSVATKEHLVSEGIRSPCMPPAKGNTEGVVSKSGSYSGCLDGEEPDEGLRSDTGRILDVCCIGDSCSSSKLNLDLVSTSLKTDGDDTCECSSSGGLVSERQSENMSERDICISIIRSHGLVEIAPRLQNCVSTDDNAVASDQNCCSRLCKVCGCSETSSKMLICDQCEDAFHTSCSVPLTKRLPIDEWFCYSCLKKKRKILNEKSSNAPANINNEDKLDPIADMLKDTKPFKSSVRVGREYQVEVPDWSPMIGENAARELEEITISEYLGLHVENSNNTLQRSSIGSWLQCHEVIEGSSEDSEGTICGKWRRAPLFEVQTDDWECFRAILWDPIHADCAVPQELPTEEVLKQLKYIEMLRPRLAAKKRKLDQTKAVDSGVPAEV